MVAHYGDKAQAQAVLSQSSFYSCNDSRLHFGLGGFNSVDLDIYWPNGLHEKYQRACGEPVDYPARRIGNSGEQGLAPSLIAPRVVSGAPGPCSIPSTQ